jgi:hypothetical protein
MQSSPENLPELSADDASARNEEYLRDYRSTPAERERVAGLLRLLPAGLATAIDIGARDGFISKAVAQHVAAVTALDLERPVVTHPRVTCVEGDATALQFAAGSFDLVVCAEVIEHIPSPALEAACKELARVAGRYVLIGVPYKQDIRHAQTTCYTCGGVNPPWAHVNTFDEERLAQLFPALKIKDVAFIGHGQPGTNALSAALLTFAGNPYGTYVQEEPCVHCDARLKAPPPRTLVQRIATRMAFMLRALLNRFRKPHANWIHVLFEKAPA